MGFKKEKELLLAALNEFSSKSYENASLNSIIKKSGISKGALYHHFKNKYDIYLYVLKDSIDKKWNFINENSGKEPKKNIFDLLYMQIELGNHFAKKYPVYASLYNMFIKEKDNEIYSKVIKDLGVNEKEGLTLLIEKAYQDNQFNKLYPKKFINKIINFFFKSYNDIFDTSLDNKLLIEFLKHGLSS